MHILLTGADGKIGSRTLAYLLDEGHSVTATDNHPFTPSVSPESSPLRTAICDLTDFSAFEKILHDSPDRIDAVIHLGAIASPMNDDDRIVHNNNVVSNYNVIRTASDYGVRRIAMASSVNAPGLSFTPEGHMHFDYLPLDEEAPMRPEDAYALSKAEAEFQATAMTRFTPGLRIASLRFSHALPSFTDAEKVSNARNLYGWVSYAACASSCLLGLTSEGWEGHEVFYIAAPEIAYDLNKGVTSLELMRREFNAKIDEVRKEWWDGRPMRGFIDTRKAERVLGWRHEES